MNLALLLLSFIFYGQNFFISFFINFTFVPSLTEFLVVVFLIALLSKTKYFKLYLFIWQLLYLIQFSFIAYFAKVVTYVDIYLFFTHIAETFESLFSMVGVVLVPVVFSLIIVSIVSFIKVKQTSINPYLLVLLTVISLYFTPKVNDGSFLLLKEIGSLYKIDTTSQIKKSKIEQTPLQQKDINIVLILGESMRAREYLTKKFSIFEDNTYKTIYSGATNTDVSIPLLINGALQPTKIDLKNNLFTLAKKNSFTTHFISTQNHNYLKYIKPYLSLSSIDNLQITESQDDLDLVSQIKKVNFKKRNFIVLQMQGEHSPYRFYPTYNKEDSLIQKYYQSMQYSASILNQLLQVLGDSNKEFIFIFTSDHGQHIGENGKFGHNSFDKEVYRVPFIYKGFEDINKEFINHHNDIYRLVHYYLGYSESFTKNTNSLKVYGTMITQEDGYKDIPILEENFN